VKTGDAKLKGLNVKACGCQLHISVLFERRCFCRRTDFFIAYQADVKNKKLKGISKNQESYLQTK